MRSLGRTYERLAGLRLEIDGYRTERHELDVSSGFRRVTTEVVLVGGGLEGRGEDVTYAAEDHDDYPAGAAAGRGVDARRVLAAGGRPGPVPRQAAPAGVLSTLPALGLRERRARPRPASAEAEPRRGAWARVLARPLRAQHPPRHQAVARAWTRSSSSSSTRRRSGTSASIAGDRGDRPCARARLQVVLHTARPWTIRPTPSSTGLVSETLPGRGARGPGARGSCARGAARTGGAVQLRCAHPLLDRRGGGAGSRGRRQRPADRGVRARATSTSSRRASAACARCSTAWSARRPPA